MSSGIRIGCSGWSYTDWRRRFYPEHLEEREWFAYYARIFDTVEINNTFYQLPTLSTIEQWRVQAPKGFRYAVKANRYLTHMKKLKDPKRPLGQFIGRIRRLGEPLGPILYQLPPRWRCDLGRLRNFLELLPGEFIHVFEFRHDSWLCDGAFQLMDEHGVSLACHDLIDMPRVVVGPVAYVRFHGTRPGYRGSYPEPILRDWALWLHHQAATGRPAFAYFNNDVAARAVVDAQALRRNVERLPDRRAGRARRSQSFGALARTVRRQPQRRS